MLDSRSGGRVLSTSSQAGGERALSEFYRLKRNGQRRGRVSRAQKFVSQRKVPSRGGSPGSPAETESVEEGSSGLSEWLRFPFCPSI